MVATGLGNGRSHETDYGVCALYYLQHSQHGLLLVLPSPCRSMCALRSGDWLRDRGPQLCSAAGQEWQQGHSGGVPQRARLFHVSLCHFCEIIIISTLHITLPPQCPAPSHYLRPSWHLQLCPPKRFGLYPSMARSPGPCRAAHSALFAPPGGACHTFQRQGYHFESGPSLYSGMTSPGKAANPLGHVLQALGEPLECVRYNGWNVSQGRQFPSIVYYR